MSRTDDREALLANLLTSIIRERIGMHERYACQMAADIMQGLADARGGEWVYVPKTRASMPRRERDEAVRRAFDGTNREQVCDAYGISRSLFYEILARRDG